MNRASGWLQSYRSIENRNTSLEKIAQKISITGGKGGVGKTTISLTLARCLAKTGSRVLLIDCDYNLSNTAIKLGLPINDAFFELLTTKKTLDEVLYKEGSFHLLAACNGHYGLLESGMEVDKILIDIIATHEKEYDFILLDSPAGLTRESLVLNAYCDKRFVVVTPDRSSITDSYSLMKILNKKYSITSNHLLLNKIKAIGQKERLVKCMSETVENFLGSHLNFIGSISKNDEFFESFSRDLDNFSDSKIHKEFFQIVRQLSEENIGHRNNTFSKVYGGEHEVLFNN